MKLRSEVTGAFLIHEKSDLYVKLWTSERRHQRLVELTDNNNDK